MENRDAPTVMLAMSGGTDSSMAAFLLQEQGYRVVGLTMVMFDGDDGGIPAFVDEAVRLAHRLGIRHRVVDVRERFAQTVIDYFVDGYAHGLTPNPCIRCNEQLKWAVLADEATRAGCHHIATGHYARVVRLNGFYHVAKGIDAAKDQSYFLYRLPQSVLERTLLPLGNMTKRQVKEEALRRGFDGLAHKRESMGVCFMNGKALDDFLVSRLPARLLEPGKVVDRCGLPIGTHRGAAFYTIGQKKGLALEQGAGWCVAQINAHSNTLVAAPSWALDCPSLSVTDLCIPNASAIDEHTRYHVRIRGIDQVPYHIGRVSINDGRMTVHFDKPVWGVTPGQSVVVYLNDVVLGGGVV